MGLGLEGLRDSSPEPGTHKGSLFRVCFFFLRRGGGRGVASMSICNITILGSLWDDIGRQARKTGIRISARGIRRSGLGFMLQDLAPNQSIVDRYDQPHPGRIMYLQQACDFEGKPGPKHPSSTKCAHFQFQDVPKP